MNEWWSGARQWWASRSLYKRAEEGHFDAGYRELDASHALGWRQFLFSLALRCLEVFGALALFIGVVFLLIWLFD